MDFTITLNHLDFSGPFDVLLNMIERKRIPLSEISIRGIIDEYITFLRLHYEVIPKESIAEFVSLATTLIFIKSQYLLPKIEKQEEGLNLLKNLELRLLLLSELRKSIKSYVFNGDSLLGKIYQESPIKKVPFSLARHHYDQSFFTRICENILLRKERNITELKDDILPSILIERTVSLPEIILFWESSFEESLGKELLFYEQFKKLLDNFGISIEKSLQKSTIKKNLAAHFLSILELSRNHNVILSQHENFGEIIIKKEM